MRAFKMIREIMLLVLLSNIICTGIIFAQTPAAAPATPAKVSSSPAKRYLDEINRLKDQKVSLAVESETYKNALAAEQQQSTALQHTINSLQAANAERDRQIAALNGSLQEVSSEAARARIYTNSLAVALALILIGIAIYTQREAIGRQLRKALEFRLVRVNGSHASQQSERSYQAPIARATISLDDSDNQIRPEEIFDRLYGRQRRA